MITAEPAGDAPIILEPNGRLTTETVGEFNHAVAKWLRRGRRNLILDLRFVSDLDGAGLGALVRTYTASQSRGGRVAFANVAGRNRELLRVTRLLAVFDVYDSTASAERSFARPLRAPSAVPSTTSSPWTTRA